MCTFGRGSSSMGCGEQRGGRVPDVRLLWWPSDLEFPSVHENSGGDHVGDDVVVVQKSGPPVTVDSQVIHYKCSDPQ